MISDSEETSYFSLSVIEYFTFPASPSSMSYACGCTFIKTLKHYFPITDLYP